MANSSAAAARRRVNAGGSATFVVAADDEQSGGRTRQDRPDQRLPGLPLVDRGFMGGQMGS